MLKLSFLLLILLVHGKAFALPEEYCGVPGIIFPDAKARELYEISQQAISNLVRDCFLKGVASSYDSLKETTACVGSPLDCAEAGVENIKNIFLFISQISNEFEKLWSSLDGLGPSEKSEIICGIVGAMAPDIILAILTEGIASGKLGITLSRISLKVQKIMEVLKSSMLVPVKWLAELSEETIDTISKVLKSPFKDNFENDLRKMGCVLR